MLERGLNDRGVMRTVITVDETRETISFFGSTAAVEGWRVCIVDTVDELNPNAANALLKILEEPPQQSLFLLVSHAPSRVLPTILSRCRKLALRPLAVDDVIRAAAAATDIEADDPALSEVAIAAEGSVARALTLLGGDALKLQQRTAALLAMLPRVDPRELHALGDALGISDRVALAAFIDGIDRWISEKLRAEDANANLPRLARLAEVWEKIVRAARDTRIVQSGAKTAGFLGVRDAGGSNPIDAQPGSNPEYLVSSHKGIRCGEEGQEENEKEGEEGSDVAARTRHREGCQEARDEDQARREEDKEVGQEERQEERQETDCEKDREEGGQEIEQEIGQEIGEEADGEETRRRAETGKRSQKGGEAESRRHPRGGRSAGRARTGAIARQGLLHHDRDRLSERHAAYRPRL